MAPPGKREMRVAGILLLLLVLPLSGAAAQTDEIQVYDAHIAATGGFNLTLHDNYIAHGSKTPEFPGALIANHSFNGVPDWAYGVTDWFEGGLSLPLYSVT